MLHVEYNNNTYTFYVTVKDITNIQSYQGFLFKFTNDMSGDVKYGYGQNKEVFDRYAKCEIFSTQAGTVLESVSGGIVNFEPNGYWKYELFLADWSEGTPCPPNPSEFGSWQCTDVADTVIASGKMNVDVYKLDNLVDDTYEIMEFDTCNPPPTAVIGVSISQTLTLKSCTEGGGDPERFLNFTRVERHSSTNTFYIDSVAEIDSEIRIYNWQRTYTHKITSSPESFDIDITTNTYYNSYTVELWVNDVLIDTYNNITTLSSDIIPDQQCILCSNNEYVDIEGSCPTTFNTLGSIFFGWNGNNNSVGGDIYGGAIEVGKLLASEQVGAEQVQYTQNENPSKDNYIYND